MGFGGFLKGQLRVGLQVGLGFLTGGVPGAIKGGIGGVQGEFARKKFTGDAKRNDTAVTENLNSFLHSVQERLNAGESNLNVLNSFSAQLDAGERDALSQLVRKESVSNSVFTQVVPGLRQQIKARIAAAQVKLKKDAQQKSLREAAQRKALTQARAAPKADEGILVFAGLGLVALLVFIVKRRRKA